MNINHHDKALLIALRKGKHFRNNPGDATNLLQARFPAIDLAEVGASVRRLHAEGTVGRVTIEGKEGRPFLRLTDSGMALADQLIEQTRTPTLRERITSIPRSDWIALLALAVSAFSLWKA